MILAIIGKIGTAGGTGHVIEYAGEVIRAMSMEGRMTVCNMSIEAGARAGLIAPDETTFRYLMGRPMAPKAGGLGAGGGVLAHPALRSGRPLRQGGRAATPPTSSRRSPGAPARRTSSRSPARCPIPPRSPTSAGAPPPSARSTTWALEPGTPINAIAVDRVFIGSCTNARIEDLRAAAEIARGRKVAASVHAMVVPGSGLVKHQAEEEGLDRIFLEAGFEWREPGCSMCLAMNADKLEPGERCASTSNRNFEGRQGRGGRTHLMSPAMAAAAAITGHITDVRKLA